MAETIKEEDKIHSYVTWPESRQIFDDGRGGLAFPEQNNSNCPEGNPVTIHLDVSCNHGENPVTEENVVFAPTHNVVIDAENHTIQLKLASFNLVGNTITVEFEDEITDAFVDCWDTTFSNHRLIPNSEDPLTVTKLNEVMLASALSRVSDNTFTASIDPITDINGFILNGVIPFDFSLSLAGISISDKVHIDVQHQDNAAENGVYLISDDVVYKVADHVSVGTPIDFDDDDSIINDPTVNDNVPCCDHYRKTYSHREVHDYTEGKLGAVTSFGVKSMSINDCDGGFIDWFTTDGEVNIGNGKVPLFVTGFGLGGMYKVSSDNPGVKTDLPRDDYDEDDGTLHPVLRWGYGTRWDSETETNISALPRDWPFTHLNNYVEQPVFRALTDTNNITLVKHADTNDDDGVGNLEFDREIEQEDPEAEPEYEHVFINRHHVVLYPNYEKITGKEGYVDGAVVVKPTFIHLPATLDTKDGETVDITVSIQNVDPTAFGDPDSALSMSGYYAAMSQPRVYVVGGVQKFSNKKLPITSVTREEGEDGYIMVSSVKAMKNDGSDALPWNTEVRANIVVSSANATGDRRTFTARGRITSYPSDMETRIRFKDKFPYVIGGRGWNDKVFTICGMAYLDENDNPTDTKLGLVSRSDDVLRGDAGTGETDALNQYNKFFTLDEAEEGDTPERTPFEHHDKRYVLATVYQTATSTFPWALSSRRKLTHVGSGWTDEMHKGSSSLMKMIYDQNKHLVESFKTDLYGTGNVNLGADDLPVTYLGNINEWKSLGSVVRVKFPNNVNDNPITEPCGNPVRQASLAVKQFVSDFLHMRLLSFNVNGNRTRKARVKINGIEIGRSRSEWPAAGDYIVGNTHSPEDSGLNAWQTELVQSAWCSNLRSLPEYVTNADTYTDEKETSIPSLFVNSFVGTPSWADYIADSPYAASAKSDYESSACTDEEPCTVAGTPDKCDTYSTNSVLTTWKKKSISSRSRRRLLNDISRYVETVLAVKYSDTYMNLTTVGEKVNGRNDGLSYDWANPFTNISSIDSTPVPELTSALDLPESQRPFMSSDAVQMYRYDQTDDDVDEVSPVMQTSDALAEFISKYVTAYGSQLPKHVYQGTRILLNGGTLPSADDSIYIRAIKRVKERNTDCTDFIGRYIDDNFANIGGDTRDPNFDRAVVSEQSVSVSVPPYVNQNAESAPKYANETYTRVYMQFTFSQKAGRWYTTDYRQYPTNYLSPLYGNDALSQTFPSIYDVDGTIHPNGTYMEDDTPQSLERPLWRNSSCYGYNSYRSHMYTTYSAVPPMDFTLGCVPFLANPTNDLSDIVFDLDTTDRTKFGNLNKEYGNSTDNGDLLPLYRLEEPYKERSNKGIGLYPPASVNGGHDSLEPGVSTDDGVHANFWSVRRFIRPAVSVLPGTDIPRNVDSDRYTSGTASIDDDVEARYGGLISDPTLYSMFDFPHAGSIEYALPNEVNPEVDMAKAYVIYNTPADGKEDVIKGKTNGSETYLGYGVGEYEQEIDRD